MIIQRENYYKKIKSAFLYLPTVTLIGARQVGKTTIMKSCDLDGEQLFLNGQDPEVAAIFQKYSNLLNYLKTNLNPSLKGYLLIDEFQYIPNISTMLKILSDNHEELKILCSGSSSLDIIQKVEESLAGRIRIIDVYPLSFEEYLKFADDRLYDLFLRYDIDSTEEIVAPEIPLILNEYLVCGGFPRVALAGKIDDKIELLDDIYRTYLLRDVRNYVRNEDTVGFNKLMRTLSYQISNLMNINNLSKLTGLSYKKCEEYLYLLEQMCIIKTVPPFYTNRKKVISKMKKIYFIDLGLRNIIYNSFNEIEFRVDNGMIFENFVFLEIMKNIAKSSHLYFYRTKDGSEIDFVVDNLMRKFAIEVKYQRFSKATGVRNIVNFVKDEYIAESYLININLNSVFGKIKYLPAFLTSKIDFS